MAISAKARATITKFASGPSVGAAFVRFAVANNPGKFSVAPPTPSVTATKTTTAAKTATVLPTFSTQAKRVISQSGLLSPSGTEKNTKKPSSKFRNIFS